MRGRKVCAYDSTIAQHSVVITPPALQVAVVKNRTSVVVSSRYRNSRAARSQVNRSGEVWSVCQLPPSPTCPKSIPSPTLQITVVEKGAGVGGFSRHPTAVRPVPRSIAVVEGASSLSFAMMVPPSPNCPRASDPQHFRSPLSRIAQVWKDPADTATAVRPVPRSIGVDEGAWLPELPSTIAQLSIVIPSPALQLAVVKDGAGVMHSSRHRNGRPACAEVDRR